jgi:succinyl-diaminopimelate desuccinylase
VTLANGLLEEPGRLSAGGILQSTKLNVDADFAVAILRRLISIPTVAPPGLNYDEISEYLYQQLLSLGFRVETVRVPDSFVAQVYPGYARMPRFIVFGSLGQGRPVLHFNAYYDVRPPTTGWDTDPFRPVVEDDRVYGLGASDSKGGIAALIAALRALVDSGWEPRLGGLEVSFTPDGKIGGLTGVGYMLAKGLTYPDYAVAVSPSSLAKIWVGAAGCIQLEVQVYRSAERPPPGAAACSNEFEAASQIACEVLKWNLSAPGAGGGQRIVSVWSPPGMGATDISRPRYGLLVERRVMLDEDASKAEQEVAALVRRAALKVIEAGFQVTLRTRFRVPPARISERAPIAGIVARAAAQVLGSEPQPDICPLPLSLNQFVERGIQAVGYGPGSLEAAQGPREHVEVDDVVAAARVYAAIAASVLGPLR